MPRCGNAARCCDFSSDRLRRGERPSVPDQAGADHRAQRDQRSRRHLRAPGRGKARGAARTAISRRQPAGRGRNPGHGGGRQVRSGRLHAARRVRQPRHQSVSLQGSALRHPRRLRLRISAGARAAGPRGEPEARPGHGRQARETRAIEAGRGQLRHGGTGLSRAAADGAAEARSGDRYHHGALQGRRHRARRPRGRAGRRHVRNGSKRELAPESGALARARGDFRTVRRRSSGRSRDERNLSRLRVRGLGGTARARKNPARDRRAPQRRGREDPRPAGHQVALRRARSRDRAGLTRRSRPVDPRGDGALGTGHSGAENHLRIGTGTGMAYENILAETRGRVGLVRLNRPKALNALNDALMNELGDALAKLDADEGVGAIVLTGSDKAFAAGADIGAMKDWGYMDVYKSDYITRNWEGLKSVRKPVIAAVAGYALGGGCELAMMCDIIIAAESAKFGQPEINLGVLPGAGGTQRLPRAVGKAKAMDMCLTARMMGAAEAERAGLVSRVVPADRLIDEALAVAAQIAEFSLPSVMMAKEAVNRAYEAPLGEGVLFERRLFHALFATEDQKEGMTAFVEKRKPSFKHR